VPMHQLLHENCELLILARSVLVNALKPNVAIIVGKKAEMEARAQFAPKYMTPATYNYEIWNQLKQAETSPSRYLPSSPGRPLKRALKGDVIHKSSGTNSIECLLLFIVAPISRLVPRFILSVANFRSALVR
jgi:hypothetical protein